MQIALFEFQTDKNIDKPFMKILTGTDGEVIDHRLQECLYFRNIEDVLKNGNKKNVTSIIGLSRKKNMWNGNYSGIMKATNNIQKGDNTYAT